MIRLLSFIGQNDSDIVPHFLDHYRRMGVGSFHVFLQGDWAEAELQPFWADDITIAGLVQKPFDEELKTVTLDALARTFPGEWLIVADTDEFLELPYDSLDQTIKALGILGLDELPGSLLQRVATDGGLDPVSTVLPLDMQFPYCDFRLAERMNVAIPIWKWKYPLMRVGPDFQLGPGHHLPSGGRPSAHVPIRCVMHHYKWRDRLIESLGRQRVNANQHEQDAYRRWLDTHDHRLPTNGLARADRASLFERGHLVRPTHAELRMRAALHRSAGSNRARAGLAKIPSVLPQADERAAALLTRAGLSQLPGRIALVTPELLGLRVTGGIGTAMTALAEQLSTAGHEVHVFLMPHSDLATLDKAWTGYWQARGVHIHQLSRGLPQGRRMDNQEASLAVCGRLLAEGAWDVVHFCDSSGLAAAPLLQRAAGLGFNGTRIVVTVHGPTRWHRSGNLLPWTSYESEISHLEALSIEMADALIFPSDYMLRWTRANFPSPAPHLLIPNALIPENRRFGRLPSARKPVTTIVFFGRMELRKGLDRFLAAIEAVLAGGRSNFDVVFLGSLGQDYSEAQLRRRLEHWRCRLTIIVNHTSQEAIDYLRAEDCLVVIPSRVDNSPYTVYECLENAIPFIASDVGGIPELVHQDDRDRAIVHGGSEHYAIRIVDALENGAVPARLSFDPARAELDLQTLHGNLVNAARGSRGKAGKPRTSTTVLVHGSSENYGQLAGVLRRWALDGVTVRWDRSPHDSSGRGTDAAALNRLAGSTDAEDLMFVHSTVTPHVETLDAMMAAMAATKADAVVCGYEVRDSGKRLPVFAGPSELSSNRNIYGTRLLVVRRDRFLWAGGFATGAEMAEIVEWELLNRMKALGGRVLAIPAAMASLATTPAVVVPSEHQSGHLCEPWTRLLTEPLGGFVRMALAQQRTASAPTGGASQQPDIEPARRAAPDMRGVVLADLLARRGATTGVPPATVGQAGIPAEGAAAVESPAAKPDIVDEDDLLAAVLANPGHETEAGRRAIGRDGRLLTPDGCYTIEVAGDAEGCDFLVADGLLDEQWCGAVVATALDAERLLIGANAESIGSSFLHLEEMHAMAPKAVDAIVAALRRAAEQVATFYGLATPLYPCRVTVDLVRPGGFVLPARPIQLEAAPADRLPDFVGSLSLDGPVEGGEFYFTALNMAVRPRPGQLTSGTATRYHETVRLAVVGGISASLSFTLRADPLGMSVAMRRIW